MCEDPLNLKQNIERHFCLKSINVYKQVENGTCKVEGNSEYCADSDMCVKTWRRPLDGDEKVGKCNQKIDLNL